MANASIPKSKLWTSYLIQGLIVLLFASGGIMNIIGNEEAAKSAADLGYIKASLPKLGVIILVSVLLYVIPKTNILGAILLTAWLGGAVATHFINLDPMAEKITPTIFGVLVWLPLLLRDEKLRSIFPFRR